MTSFAPGAYQWVSEKMTYADAQANAEKLGGNLVSVTSAEEAAGMYELVSGIYANNSSESLWGVANDGGGISYVWLGASDAVAEGTWIWETGDVFDYANWGQAEPDNYGGDQDALGLGLANWPDGSTGDDAYGLAGQWNDINAGNLLTSIVEYANGATVGVKEGAESANSIVYVAIADDVDSDAITLTLGGTDAAAFTIDSSGDGIGIVRLKEAADYETKTSYSFELIATEGGVSTTKAVTLNVLDVEEVVAKVINVSASTVTESEASIAINAQDYSSGSAANYIQLTATLDATQLTGSGSTEISGANFSISPVVADLENVSADVENEGAATQGLEYKFLSSKITGLVNDVLSSNNFGDTALASDSVLVDLDTSTNRIDSSDEVVTIFLNPKDTVTSTNFTVTGSVTLGDGSTVEQESYIVSLDIV